MNRYVKRTRIWRQAALVATIMLTGGCQWFSDGGAQAGSVYDDAGNCVKDREELSEILVQPVPCSTSAECPGGSFCNGETGQCDWQCYTDSDCGFGGTCTCDGQCTDGTPTDPDSEDPACPRNLHLLQGQHIDDTDCPTGATCPASCASDADCPYNTTCDLAVSQCKYPTLKDERECLRDEQCPSGARCDTVSRRCTYDCLADTDCQSGEVCDCRGECVVPGSPSEGPDMAAARVEVSPSAIAVPVDHAWGKQTISIHITHDDETLADRFKPRARIEARDPDGLGAMGIVDSEQVAETVTVPAGVALSTSEESRVLDRANMATQTALESDGIPASTAAAIIAARPLADIDALLAVENVGASTLQALKTATEIQSATCAAQIDVLDDLDWTVTANSTDGYSATASISIERCSAPYTGESAYPRDIAVSVYFVDQADSTIVTQKLDHQLVTIGTEGVADTAATPTTGEFSGVVYQETTGAEPLAIPVKAWGTSSGGLLVQDELYLLSESGWFELEPGVSTYVNQVNQKTNNGGVGDGQSAGLLAGELSDWLDDPLSGGRRDGTFRLTLPTSPEQPILFRYRLLRESGDAAPNPGATWPTQSEHTLVNMADLWRSSAVDLQSLVSSDTRRRSIERILCYDFNDYQSSPVFKDFAFQDSSTAATYPATLLAPSRDLQCTTQSQSAVGLLTDWSSWAYPATPLPALTTPPDTAAGWLTECMNDLSRPLPSVGSGGSTSDRVLAWFGSPNACINLAQVFPALGALTHDTINGTGQRYIDRADSALFQRLLAQWLDVHSFVLQQGVQESKAQAHLARELVSEESVRLEGVLAQTERAWDVLFDPDLIDPNSAGVLTKVPRNTLADPDYRVPRPTAYWTFDSADRSGNYFLDAAGERHLNLSGSYFADDEGIQLENTSANLPAGDLAPHGDVTIAFWFRWNYSGYFNETIFKNDEALEVELDQNDGQWRVRIDQDPSGLWGISTSWVSFNPSWEHLAIVRTGNSYTIYHNGSWLYQESYGMPSYNETLVSSLLESSSSSPFSIDDLAIWESPLSAEMVQQVYNAGQSSAANPRPLLAPIGALWSDPSSPSYQGSDPDAEQGLGLAVKIAETASKHAATVEAFAVDQLDEVYGGCYLTGSSSGQQQALERAASGLRYVGTAETLARDLRYRAAEVPCTQALECTYAGGSTCGAEGLCLNADGTVLERALAWDDRFNDAISELGAARGRAVLAMKKLARCENPLGIPENDQPIYFGDVAGENSRYFASSDYLVESWARPAVQTATNALEAARSAWLAARDSDIRQQMNEYEAERRLESIELSYMNPVMDACGITDMDGLEVLASFESDDPSSLDLETCYRTAGCADRDDPSCLRGTLGEAMLSVKAASAALVAEENQSKKRWIDWDAQVETCRFRAESIDGDLAAIQTYNDQAVEARKRAKGLLGRGLVETFGNTLGSTLEDIFGGCFSGAASGSVGGGPGAAAGCLGGGLLGALTSDMGAPEDLAQAREQLELTLAVGQAERDMRACYDELDRRQREWFFGQDFIRLRHADLAQAWFRLDEIGRDVVRNLREARAAIDREVGRTLPSVAHHYWSDEKIDRFTKEFERAKRLTYLAMRAVEYEFQQSLGLRSDILTASHPDVLLGAIYVLDAERGTRTINSRRPAEGTEVLSLRTDILRLGTLKPPGPGERSDSASLRLQDMLRDPRFAYRDEEGNYLGQAIPFTLEESGALRHRCGERLWRVNATIQGDLSDITEPRAQVFLRKKNVFQSQWCEGLGDGTPYQEASTAGGSNLFTADRSTVGRKGSEYTTSLLFPWYNVRRSDFYREEYTEGASEELAGRGLYGEYVLLFPYNGMLEPPLDCQEPDGYGCADPFRHLEKIEDVLIRFDYYSVDDL